MIGLDTHVLVRYIMQDDPRQSPMASRLVESLTAEAPGFVSLIAVIELTRVLESAYKLERAQVGSALEALLRTKELVVERADTVWKALRTYQHTKADFADALIERSSATAGCSRTMTFDRSAARHCGMTLVG
jgi:predicted nucleic-acid-binding protein